MHLIYCDKIAYTIKELLKNTEFKVLDINWDLDANGALNSTKKTLEVEDRNGTQYLITITEKEN